MFCAKDLKAPLQREALNTSSVCPYGQPPSPQGEGFFWREQASRSEKPNRPTEEQNSTRRNHRGAEQAPKSSSVLSGKRGMHTKV